jgi:hypothetical protein
VTLTPYYAKRFLGARFIRFKSILLKCGSLRFLTLSGQSGGRPIRDRIVVGERGKILHDEKEQYTKETPENDVGKRQKGDAAAPTGGLSSQRSEISSHFVCRDDHKKTAPAEARAGQMFLLTRNIHAATVKQRPSIQAGIKWRLTAMAA